MRIAESIADVRYVTNESGDRTDVLVPMSAWESLLTLLETMTEHLEDQEDIAALKDWLQTRTAGEGTTISLAALKEELHRDGLLSG